MGQAFQATVIKQLDRDPGSNPGGRILPNLYFLYIQIKSMAGLSKDWIKFYDKTAIDRETALGKNNFGKIGPIKIIGENGDRAWIETIKSRLKNGMRIIDIGCGTGIHLREIHRATNKNVKMIGIDISPGMIKVAKNKSRKMKNLEFFVMDTYKTRFKDNYFDIVINRLGVKSNKEVFRILKKGGYYFLFVTGRDDWKEMVKLFSFKKSDDLRFHKKLLKEAGFKITKIKKYSSAEYYKNVGSLAKTLDIVPFKPPFNRKKHLAKLKKYAVKHATPLGIESTQRRVIITCKK